MKWSHSTGEYVLIMRCKISQLSLTGLIGSYTLLDPLTQTYYMSFYSF
jgi:hypothetical protein